MSADISTPGAASPAWWYRIPAEVRTAGLAVATVAGALWATGARPAPVSASGPRPVVDALAPLVPSLPTAASVGVAVVVGFVALVLVHRLARTEALPAVADRATWLAALATVPGAAWADPALVAGIAATLYGALALHRDRPVAAGLACAGAVALAAPAGAALVFAAVALARPRGPNLRSVRAAAAAGLPLVTLAALVAADVHFTAATPHRSLAAIALGPGTPQVPWQPAVDALSGTVAVPELVALVAAAALAIGPRRWLAARIHGVALALAVAASIVAAPVALVAAPIVVLAVADGIDRATWLDRPLLVVLALWLIH